MPIAIKTNGIEILHNPIKAYNFQFWEKASILISLNLHKRTKGILANITLTRASVKGSYEYVAIFILKKAEPQIIANNISNEKSKELASLISSENCIHVINA